MSHFLIYFLFLFNALSDSVLALKVTFLEVSHGFHTTHGFLFLFLCLMNQLGCKKVANKLDLT